MARRSALDPMKDQIVMWLNQGQTNAWMAAKLEEYGIKRTPQQVGSFAKKLVAPTLSKVSEKVNVQFASLEQGISEALSKYVDLLNKEEKEMSMDERNYFRTVGEWFDRIAKLRGLYAPQNLTQVAVQVNQGPDLKKRLWAILGDETIGGNG